MSPQTKWERGFWAALRDSKRRVKPFPLSKYRPRKKKRVKKRRF